VTTDEPVLYRADGSPRSHLRIDPLLFDGPVKVTHRAMSFDRWRLDDSPNRTCRTIIF
jgi:hypothetical protein